MTIGDGHDLQSPRFRGDLILEACFDEEHRMLIPENGPAVGKVQVALVDLGYIPSYRDVNNQFRRTTELAVASFKRDRSIFPSDGVVGPKTMGALDALFAVRPLNTGAFAPFVTDARLDDDVADLLRELDGAPDVWAKQVAQFVFHELQVGNLIGIVRVANAATIRARLPEAFRPKLDQLVASAGTFRAVTDPVEVNPNQFQGYTLVNDGFINSTHPGESDHNRGMLTLTHEMMHFRNRDFFVGLDRSTVTDNPGLYVDLAAATAHGATPRVASQFMQELICRHAAFRVKQDLDLRNGRIPPLLQPGQLYQFALDLGRQTFDNGYVAGLAPEVYNVQIAVWMREAGRHLFHDDPARNDEVRVLFEDEFSRAQPAFATPAVAMAGGE